MAKTIYSVELQANSYMDDIFVSEDIDECRAYCKKHEFTDEDGRIAEILDDGDPLVVAFHEISED